MHSCINFAVPKIRLFLRLNFRWIFSKNGFLLIDKSLAVVGDTIMKQCVLFK